MIFVYKIENAILVKKQRTKAKNIQNIIFVIYIFYKKNIVNI